MENGVWFVYDGECPLCNAAAQMLRIKSDYGTLHLVNARTEKDTELLQEIKKRGFNLDEGMVIYASGRFYHGRDALKFMANYAEAGNFLGKLCKILFCSEAVSSIAYSVMRAIRNLLLRLKGIEKIKNL